DGRIEALAAGRRWEEDEQFDDIAVLVRDDRRGQGWGTAVVGALCRSSFELDRLPLYRCNWSRTASKALALRLGFQRVGTLVAITPPDHNPMRDAHS
ncbi:MAG: GNAT family N-acetyltransferase, partial [Acidimicrobiales bacterium]|nr:GNAT family N-acetyltransferase [Acidimicrobiales bacterium]